MESALQQALSQATGFLKRGVSNIMTLSPSFPNLATEGTFSAQPKTRVKRNVFLEAIKPFGVIGNISKGINDIPQGIGKGVRRVVQEFSYSPKTIPQDFPYRFATLANEYQKSILPHINPEKVNAMEELFIKREEKLRLKNPETTSFILKFLNSVPEPEPPSANLYRLYEEAPRENLAGRQIKTEALQNPNLYPGLKRYLESVPVVNREIDPRFAGFFHLPSIMGQQGNFLPIPGQKHIEIGTGMSPRNTQETATHELMHATANAFGVKKLTGFVADFKRAAQRDPNRYKTIAEWMGKYKQNYPGYFAKNPLTEANELFAQIGSVFGQDLLSDPFLAKYYAQVFNPKINVAGARTQKR